MRKSKNEEKRKNVTVSQYSVVYQRIDIVVSKIDIEKEEISHELDYFESLLNGRTEAEREIGEIKYEENKIEKYKRSFQLKLFKSQVINSQENSI